MQYRIVKYFCTYRWLICKGKKGVGEAALAEIIQRFSQLVTDLPMIQEMDLNPVMAFEDKAFVVDARIII
ncbi:MAG: hypothetical protein GY795_51280 [Desulfobacterales bacterium]|nr:hypothetical protein [Desulfobacterales bacterium]